MLSASDEERTGRCRLTPPLDAVAAGSRTSTVVKTRSESTHSRLRVIILSAMMRIWVIIDVLYSCSLYAQMCTRESCPVVHTHTRTHD